MGFSRYLEFDAVGNLTERTDRNGLIREFDYDALNRLTEERWIENGATVNTINLTFDAARHHYLFFPRFKWIPWSRQSLL